MEHVSTIDDDYLLEFVAGTLPAAETFPVAAREMMKRFARRAAPEFPPDLHDEIVSQSFEYLIEDGKRFEPARGSASTFLKLMIRKAARKVRADYCPPGCRTRLDPRDQAAARRNVVPFAEVEEEIPGTVTDLDAACDVRAILGGAPTTIAPALVLIYGAGETVLAAAKTIGMSRFTLSREVSRFFEVVRETRAA